MGAAAELRFLADLLLWTLSGICALMPEPILDLARVTHLRAVGLMAHFARHTELLGPDRPSLLCQHSAPRGRGCRQKCAEMWQHTKRHPAGTKTRRPRENIAQHSRLSRKMASCRLKKQISCSWCNITLLLLLLWCGKIRLNSDVYASGKDIYSTRETDCWWAKQRSEAKDVPGVFASSFLAKSQYFQTRMHPL